MLFFMTVTGQPTDDSEVKLNGIVWTYLAAYNLNNAFHFGSLVGEKSLLFEAVGAA